MNYGVYHIFQWKMKMPMGIFRWKLKSLAKALIVLLFLCTFIITINFSSEKSHKTNAILRALGSRSVKEMVQPFTDTFLINNHWQNNNGDLQSRVTDKENVFLVVVITSLPENIHRRNIIRSSWMKYNPNKNTIVVFFTGRPNNNEVSTLQHESDKYGDLIVDDFEENYYSLSVKTLRILKWFNMNLPKANFLVKTDDDVYINTPLLIEYLVSVKEKSISKDANENLYLGGVVASGRSPHTVNSFSKWYVPPELWKTQKLGIESLTKHPYDYDSYPDYLEGNFYAISGTTVPLILNISLNLPLFHLEDVYITGLIGSKILQIKVDSVSNIFTDSATWPRFNYYYNKLFISPKNIIAYHCDNDVEIIQQIYNECN